jgi:hypothetical protein
VADRLERQRVYASIRQVILVDELTENPLAGVQLIVGAHTAVSDQHGRASVQTNGSPSSTQVRLVTSAEHGGQSFQRTLIVAGPEREVIKLPIWSGVRVELQSAMEQVDGVVLCRPVRELDQLGLPAKTVRQLELAKHQPGVIERHLDELGVDRDRGRVSQGFKIGNSTDTHTIIYSLAGGAAFLSVFGRGLNDLPSGESQLEELAPQHTKLILRPGRMSKVRLALAPKPVVAGRLVDHNGNAIPNTVVVAAASSTFDSSECVSHDSAEPGSAAIALVRPIGSRRTTGLIHRSVKTDALGRFRIPVSFSDHIAVWAFPAEHGIAYLEYDAGNRGISVRDLTLQARSAATDRRIPIQDLSKQDLPVGTRVQLRCLSQFHPFQCHPPGQRLSEDGTVDMRYCIPGAQYRLIFPDGEYGAMTIPGTSAALTAVLR